jgi:hypothetical protein
MQSLGSNWPSNNENAWQHRHSDGKGSEMHLLFDGQLEPSDCITDTPTLEQFVSTLLCLKQAILVFWGTNITEEELQMC